MQDPKAKGNPKQTPQKKEKAKKSSGKVAEKKDNSADKTVEAPKEGKKEIRLKKEYNNPTPKGEKKDVIQIPMIDAYDPPTVEAAWYDWWEHSGFFRADNQDTTREKFIIVIPPPNVTGSLHMGHALTNSIQDALIRWHRMCGKNVLWVPGTDHAGIATQAIVEKKIKRERGLTRHDLGREAFVKEVWKWKDQYGAQICNQLRRLGSSLDWSREVFTMDEKLSRAVIEAFVRLYDQGLIYRGTRLVNWCCELKTAISDIEVDKKELEGRTEMRVPGHDPEKFYEFGVLVSFAYPIDGSDEEIVVSTTRVETMLGDTAVAIHPEDARYKHLHGKYVVHPFDGRKLPIVLDDKLVKMEFGTGAVKVTPAHDPNDFECGRRHNLPMINIFTDDGLINKKGGQFKGMKRFDARNAILEALKEKGLLRDIKPNQMVLPLCSRTKDIIEPRLKPQWWVKCDTMAAAAVEAVKEGRLQIIPNTHEVIWFRWLENCQDWCISRQLWWGHRIPAYLVSIEGQPPPDPREQNNWVVGRTEEEARVRAQALHSGVPPEKIKLDQDPDVLDTWFSSGLFPFSSFGWPDEQSQDFKAFYPTSLLETGHDILFFWVARMVMMGLTLTGKLPFNQILLHAMVRDAHGRKMSKSLGNVVDPLDVTEGITLEDMHKKLYTGNLDPKEIATAIEGQKKDFPNGISECGTDAMRFALCAYTSQGRAINLDINRVIGYRHFCNKLWNATKFAMMNLGPHYQPNPTLQMSGRESVIERWILSRLHKAMVEAEEGWHSFELGRTTTAIYNFWLYELCDVYLEAIKPAMRIKGSPEQRSCQDTLYTCLELGLRLLHPFMPFVTEELYQRIPRRPGDTCPSIMLSPYPRPGLVAGGWDDDAVEERVRLTQEVVRLARSLRTDYGLKPNAKPAYYLRLLDPDLKRVFEAEGYGATLGVLANAGEVHILGKDDRPPIGCAMHIVNENCEIHLLIKGLVDVDAEIQKLKKKLESTESQYDALYAKTLQPLYDNKVPEKVKNANTERMQKLKQEAEAIKQAIEKFAQLKEGS